MALSPVYRIVCYKDFCRSMYKLVPNRACSVEKLICIMYRTWNNHHCTIYFCTDREVYNGSCTEIEMIKKLNYWKLFVITSQRIVNFKDAYHLIILQARRLFTHFVLQLHLVKPCLPKKEIFLFILRMLIVFWLLKSFI